MNRYMSYQFRKQEHGYIICVGGIDVGLVEKVQDSWEAYIKEEEELFVLTGTGDTRREATEDLLKRHVFPFKEGRIGWAKEKA
jgi:hypothetical protein